MKTDSPLALFSVVAISQPHLAIEPKSIHVSPLGYHRHLKNAIGNWLGLRPETPVFGNLLRRKLVGELFETLALAGVSICTIRFLPVARTSSIWASRSSWYLTKSSRMVFRRSD